MTLSTPQHDRIASIDILRGIAIFGMILCANIGWNSGLPAWMFHAQVPPPDYVFSPDVRGITWVDLVFPFFLFSMGAAFPFAMTKRINSGIPKWKIILGLFKRWLILAAFAIVLGNGYHARTSESGELMICLFLLLLWGGLFLSLARFRFKRELYCHLANASGVILLVGLGFLSGHLLGVTPSKDKSDIIIMVLAYVAALGGIIWLFTRNSLGARCGVLMLVVLIKALDSYVPGIFSFMPDPWSIGIGWIFSWRFLQYLVIAIIGSMVGDMILKKKSAPMASVRGDYWLVLVAFATVVFQLWGLFTRHVTVDFLVSAAAGIAFIALTFRSGNLWSEIVSLGYLIMLAGIVADPFDGGIAKDFCNLSYLLTTSGMAAMVTGCLLFLETRLGVRSRVLSECGQNPMIAYTVTNFVTVPLLSVTGLLPLIDAWAAGAPFPGLLRGLLITGLMMVITVVFTRLRIFWRS